MTIAIKTKLPEPPPELLTALAKARLRYTEPRDIQYHIYLRSEHCHCGVFGDGDNGSYEWFVWKDGELAISDSGYGIPEVALRNVLNRLIS